VEKAADGATSLHKGLLDAKQGSASLVSGLTDLDSGAAELVSANQQIAQGNKQLADLVDSVAGSASDALPAVANQTVAAAKTLERSADTVASATGAAKTQTESVVTDLQDLADKCPDIAGDPLYQRALQSAQQAATAAALALVLLMLQLTACGGLYPIETSPGFFQALHPIMPMTYLVNGLRVTISGGESGQLWQSVGVLAGVLVVFLFLGTLIVSRHRQWTMRRLRPDIADAP
jgi:uncharacterized phage infection (PIP) family protein YhgE